MRRCIDRAGYLHIISGRGYIIRARPKGVIYRARPRGVTCTSPMLRDGEDPVV